MATYNFTIRASDTAGAFADQNFSIEVQRTRIDRFVAVHSSGISRSVDGKTWFAEAAPAGMTSVSYGNAQWVGVANNNGTQVTIVTSTDAVNWRIGSPITLPKPTGQTGSVLLTQIKWRNGRWMAFGYGTTPVQVIEWSSSDLINWTAVGGFTPANTVSGATVMEFEYDASTQTTVVQVEGTGSSTVPTLSGLYTRVGSGAFTQTCAFSANNNEGYLQFRNGLWMSHNLSQMVYLSRDGINWFSRIPVGNGSQINGLSFNNGTLIATGVNGSAVSQDGGITWALRSVSTPNSRQMNASYGGVTVYVSANNSQLWYSTNNLTTVTQTPTGSVVALAGGIRSIATRQD